MKIFTSLPCVLLCLAALIAAAHPALTHSFSPAGTLLLAQSTTNNQPPKTTPKKKQPPLDPAKEREKRAAQLRAANRAASLLARCREKMDGRIVPKVETYRAVLEEKIKIGRSDFTATGTYIQGTGLRRRLELKLNFGTDARERTAMLVQVCDGSVLRTLQTIDGVSQVTRRNVSEILRVSRNVSRANVSDRIVALGLGGISGLIASLQLSMTFDKYETRQVGNATLDIIEGAWNETYEQQWEQLRKRDSKHRLPEHVPQRVRVKVDENYLVREIVYLGVDEKTRKPVPLLSLFFRKIEINPPDLMPKEEDTVGRAKLRQLFELKVPGKVIRRRDTTKEYTLRLQAPPPRPAAKR